ncbi:MAG: cation-translocating P-type ATPase [Gammaproteobacteria bacterium]|nr:cation-translocating P-type ATPase [Gammaproteobacteria bacterium]
MNNHKPLHQGQWSSLTPAEVCERLRVDPTQGLTGAEAGRRQASCGRNEIREGKRRPLWLMLLDQFRDFMIVVLLATAIISGVIGEAADTVAILVIVVLNATFGAVQAYRAERAIAALKSMAASSAQVIRDGECSSVNAVDLVPGDLVSVDAGNVIPADLRLVECAGLEINEAALTGESMGIVKSSNAIGATGLQVGERLNMAFKGTQVNAGRGIGVVTGIGMHTELGRIAGLLQTTKESRTPLQKRLGAFGKRLAIAVLAICAIIFTVGLLRGEALVLMFLTAISLAVAAIPEALPAVISVSLALGARRMSRENALIRNLPAVETLGSVTFICSDKTGTLTRNRMSVDVLYTGAGLSDELPAGDNPLWQHLREALALNNDVVITAGRLTGDPTEVALCEAAQRAGLSKVDAEIRLPRIDERVFDSARMRMTTLHRSGDGAIAFTKGAPESVLPLCREGLTGAGATVLDRNAVLDQANRLAIRGYRVLAIAMRQFTQASTIDRRDSLESDLCFLGLVGLIDPPREGALRAVEQCRSAGITPVMITGDHPATAHAIARRLNINVENGEVLTGDELDNLGDGEFRQRVGRIRVYARVSPQQKIRIVNALQETGEFCAMTGDGVNDAPALKQADIGIAMGLKGTDVAREAADMVLLDDNFATIVTAVREGRRIFDNIRKFIKYTMTSNAGEIWTLFLAPFLGLPMPLLPIHILWINLVTDGLPGLALALEPHEKGILQRPPRPPNENIFAHGMWQHIVWVGLLIGGLSLLAQALAFHHGSSHWQTMVFTTLTLAQLAHVMAIRSESQSLFTIGLFSNTPLLGAVLGTVVLQLGVIYVPWLNGVFRTAPLDAIELGLCFLLAAAVFMAVETEKWLVRRGVIYQAKNASGRNGS